MSAHEKSIYSLSDLAEGIRFAIYRSFPDRFWVQAEIAKLNIYPRSGHAYLDLVEKEDGKTKSQMRGIIWADDFSDIQERFEEVTREPFREGLNVLFFARMNYHALYGFSLWISDVEPSFTLGELTRLKVQTIERLQKEELFDLNKQLPIPATPLRIAVISAETSKGYLDFLEVIKQHPIPYRFEITLFPALLQGDKAIDSIRGQLKVISGIQLSSIQHPASSFDLLAIIRGGGDEIGLTCFDDYDLAREICQFPMPVITGIGHSTNETVVELVAAVNKITPTEVGYYLLSQLDEVTNNLDEMNLQVNVMTMGIVKARRAQVDGISDNLIRDARHFFSSHTNRLNHIEQLVRNLDPKNILQRGFSLTYDQQGNILKDSQAVSSGDKITTELQSGTIQSTVDS